MDMRKILLLLVFCFPALAAIVTGQENAYLKKYHEGLAKKPNDLRVELRLPDNKIRFHQGEIIRLGVEFSSTQAGYKLANRTYDRSGRLWIDGFVVDRADDVKDPLQDYFHKSLKGFVGGGIYSEPDLSVGGVVVNYVLNEMYAIEKPGRYRLYVTSSRVRKKGTVRFDDYVGAVSNIVEFEILPIDIEWQKQKLAEAVRSTDPGCQTLRYLRSEGAALAMVERYRGHNGVTVIGSCQFDLMMGLYSSPYRALIVGKMEEKLRDPNTAISTDFLSELATLSFLLHYGDAYPGWESAADFKEYQKKLDALKTLRDREFGKYAAILETALKDKKPDIYTASVNAAFSFRTPGTEMDDRLVSAFDTLSSEEQKTLLTYRWENIRTPKLLPGFRRILERLDGPGQGNYNSELRDLVLRRLYDLAPAEGRERLLAEIRRAENRVEDKTLVALSDKELPELEELLLKRATVANTPDARRALLVLERYGTPRAAKALFSAYFERIGGIECSTQRSIINYFLKHEPETGAKIVDAALNARKQTACFKTLFNDFEPKYWSRELESVVVSHLDDPDIGVVKEVLEALRAFGSVESKPLIWKRFERFKASPENDMAAKIRTYGDQWQPQLTIEDSFVWALEGAVNWKLSQEELSKLAELCVTDGCRKFLEANKAGLIRWANE